jgi:hypothetical protein
VLDGHGFAGEEWEARRMEGSPHLVMVGAPWRVRDGRHVWFWDEHFTVML